MVYFYTLTSQDGEHSCPLVRLCLLILLLLLLLFDVYLYILCSLHFLSLQGGFVLKAFYGKAISSLWSTMPCHNSSFLRLKTQDDIIFEVLNRNVALYMDQSIPSRFLLGLFVGRLSR